MHEHYTHSCKQISHFLSLFFGLLYQERWYSHLGVPLWSFFATKWHFLLTFQLLVISMRSRKNVPGSRVEKVSRLIQIFLFSSSSFLLVQIKVCCQETASINWTSLLHIRGDEFHYLNGRTLLVSPASADWWKWDEADPCAPTRRRWQFSDLIFEQKGKRPTVVSSSPSAKAENHIHYWRLLFKHVTLTSISSKSPRDQAAGEGDKCCFSKRSHTNQHLMN